MQTTRPYRDTGKYTDDRQTTRHTQRDTGRYTDDMQTLDTERHR